MQLDYLRALLITDPILVLITMVMGSISAFVSLFDSEGRRQHDVARVWARMILRIAGITVRLQGLERLDLQKHYVFVGNHLSLMDTPVVIGGVPLQLRFVANQRYFRFPFLGTHMRRSGHLPVNSSDARASLKTMSEAARLVRERSLSVLLFPEGTRSAGQLRQFKEGAAYIAIKAGAPVVPIAIIGTHEVLPRGSVHIRGGTVEVRIGEPIPTHGLTLKDRAKLTQIMHDRIETLLAGDAFRSETGSPAYSQ